MIECCADYARGMNIIGGIIEDVSAGVGHDVYAHAGGRPFRYCPWCGVLRKEFEREFKMKQSEAESKELI